MSNPIFSNIVLNTPFCLLHSLNSNKLNEYEYFNVNELVPKFSDIKSNSINSNLAYIIAILFLLISLSFDLTRSKTIKALVDPNINKEELGKIIISCH